MNDHFFKWKPGVGGRSTLKQDNSFTNANVVSESQGQKDKCYTGNRVSIGVGDRHATMSPHQNDKRTVE